MSKIKIVFAAMLLFALAGCVTPIKPNMPDVATLPAGDGVMVVRVAAPYMLRARSAMAFSLVKEDGALAAPKQLSMTSAETFFVVTLPAGKYRWDAMSTPLHFAKLRGKTFDIVAGKINYVGDITVVMRSQQSGKSNIGKYSVDFEVYDYHEHFLPLVAYSYPLLWANYPVVLEITHS